MRIFLPVFLLVGLTTAGCVNQTIRLADTGGEDRITGEDGVNVRIVPDIGERPESFTIGDRAVQHTQLATGAIWRRVFVGGPNAVATFEIISTRFSEHRGFTIRDTYEIDGKLIVGETAIPIHASGSRATGWELDSARRQAVELAVVDAARQAKAILKRGQTAH